MGSVAAGVSCLFSLPGMTVLLFSHVHQSAYAWPFAQASEILRLERQVSTAAKQEAQSLKKRATAAEEAAQAVRSALDVTTLKARAEVAEAQAREAKRAASEARAGAESALAQLAAARDEVEALRARLRGVEESAAVRMDLSLICIYPLQDENLKRPGFLSTQLRGKL